MKCCSKRFGVSLVRSLLVLLRSADAVLCRAYSARIGPVTTLDDPGNRPDDPSCGLTGKCVLSGQCRLRNGGFVNVCAASVGNAK
jgi:hypothetical protein